MKIRVYHVMLVVAAIAMLVLAKGVTAGAITGDLELTSDNEDVSTVRWLVGYQENFNDWKLGVKHGKFTIDEPTDRVTFNDTRITFSRRLDERLNLHGFVGSLYRSDWTLPTASLTAEFKPNEKWYFEYNLERNAIDSFKATTKRVSYTGSTVSADYKITPELVGVGIYSFANLTDNNNKDMFEGRLIYDINTVAGLSVQYHHRNVAYDFNTVEYFAPKAWTRNLFGVGYVKGFGLNHAWLFRGKLLTGPQSIDNDSGKFTEIKLNLDYAINGVTDIVVFHDRIISTGTGYEYEWEYTGARVIHRF